MKISLQNIYKKEISLTAILHNSKNLILKIDIEGDEYKILNSIIENSSKINCLLIEFHSIQKNIALIEKFIRDNNNLKLIHIHGNNVSGVCKNKLPKTLEVTFLNRSDFFKDNQQTKFNFPIDKIDFPNHPYIKDIEINFR